jgi:hypothetical protein
VGSPSILMTTLKNKAKDTIDKTTEVVKATITNNDSKSDDNHSDIDAEFMTRGDAAGGLKGKKKEL